MIIIRGEQAVRTPGGMPIQISSDSARHTPTTNHAQQSYRVFRGEENESNRATEQNFCGLVLADARAKGGGLLCSGTQSFSPQLPSLDSEINLGVSLLGPWLKT